MNLRPTHMDADAALYTPRSSAPKHPFQPKAITPDMEVARAEKADAEQLHILSAHPDWVVRWMVAQHSNTDRGTLRDMAHSVADPPTDLDEYAVLMAVASHPAVDPETLDYLAATRYRWLALRVAETQGDSAYNTAGAFLPPEVRVRRAVAKHPNASVGTLAMMASDPDVEVRRAVARHPNTSAETLSQLSEDPDGQIMSSVFVHPNSPRGAVYEVSRDRVGLANALRLHHRPPWEPRGAERLEGREDRRFSAVEDRVLVAFEWRKELGAVNAWPRNREAAEEFGHPYNDFQVSMAALSLMREGYVEFGEGGMRLRSALTPDMVLGGAR